MIFITYFSWYIPSLVLHHFERTHEGARHIIMTLETDAYMMVTNDYSQPLVLTTSNNAHMENTFPSQIIGAGMRSPSSYISASAFPAQSHFNIAYGSNTMKVDIGQSRYVTDVNFSGPNGQASALLAPTKPFSNGVDYTFYFFGGPGVLPPLVNSFIAANLPAIVAYVATNPLHLDIAHNTKLTIKQLGLTPQSITCDYAAVSPVKPGDSDRWHVNVIFSLRGKVSGSITYNSVSNDFMVSLGGGSALIQATVDMSDLTNFSCTVTRLAFSIQSFNINNGLLKFLKTAFLGLYEVIGTPYHLAGALNTNFNGIIVEKINSAIANLTKSLLCNQAFNKVPASDKTSYDYVHKTQKVTTDYSTWMSTPKIQAKTLSQLKIPGTHDSGSYGLTRTLSQIIYDDIKFLWTLSPDDAPPNGQLPFSTGTIYVGKTLLNYVMDTVLGVSIAQGLTIRKQLNDGIRFFDLRVYYDTDGSFYIQHGLRGPQLNDLLAEVRTFLDAHATSGELVFLSISHTNFGDDPVNLPAKAETIIQNNLKPYLYMPANSTNVTDFDFQNLKDTILSSITSTSPNVTSPKVIVLNTDESEKYFYNQTVVNTKGFADSGRWEENSSGVASIEELTQLEGDGLHSNTNPMYQVTWTLTPQTMDIVQSVLSNLSGNASMNMLKQFASETNAALQGFLATHTANTFNLVIVDWPEVSLGASPIDVIVEMN